MSNPKTKRNRLILELMARGGMRIGEVLKLRFCDIQDRKLIIKDPKSGKEQEVVFIPQKVADRLRKYARQNCKNPEDRIFPISYKAARIMVLKAGDMVGIHLRPHICASLWRRRHPDPEFLTRL